MKTIEHYQTKIHDALNGKIYGNFPAELYQPITYTMSLGGKRLRPVLTLMACDCFDPNFDNALPAAIAIELFHNFTLLHDDIMDNAPLRRNQPTVHKKWNNSIAILSGDAMMVCAYQELCKSNALLLPPLLELFSNTAIKVCEGQQLDMNYEKLNKITVAQYLKMIELKTAVLLGAALQMGAIAGNAREEDALRLYEFGKHIGMAFQLQDDILDVYGNEQKFGKLKGGDIIANKKTFLLLKTIEMAESNRYLKEELHQWLHAPEFVPTEKVEAITAIYDFFNVKELAQKEIQKHYTRANEYLQELIVSEINKQQFIYFADSLRIREV